MSSTNFNSLSNEIDKSLNKATKDIADIKKREHLLGLDAYRNVPKRDIGKQEPKFNVDIKVNIDEISADKELNRNDKAFIDAVNIQLFGKSYADMKKLLHGMFLQLYASAQSKPALYENSKLFNIRMRQVYFLILAIKEKCKKSDLPDFANNVIENIIGMYNGLPEIKRNLARNFFTELRSIFPDNAEFKENINEMTVAGTLYRNDIALDLLVEKYKAKIKPVPIGPLNTYGGYKQKYLKYKQKYLELKNSSLIKN